jgi:diguanylate cyclase (GGDEF)-like protein
MTAAEKIRQQLRQPFLINGLQLSISCSIGVALYPEHGQELTELSRHADLAMYHAKEAGRDNTQLFDPQMLKDA